MCYTYDSLGRVTKRTKKNLSNVVLSEESFTYDAAGNVTDAPDSCFAYDTNNRLTAFNGSPVSYDLDGNMLSNGSLTCTYNSANRLVSAGGHTYTYNAEDVRIRNLCPCSEDTSYTYNTNAKLSMLLTKTTCGVVTKYVYGRGLIGEESGNVFKTYHFDCRGSTIAITNASGNITDTFAYDTYGKLISRTGTSEIIFVYNGRDGVVTDDNGLIYMRARYYSPEMKRFVNADLVAGAISSAITLNRFAYANGNPVSFVDPFGLWSLKGAWNSFTSWAGNTANGIKNWAVDTYNNAKDAVVDTYNTVKDAVVDTYNNAKDFVVDTYNDAKQTVVETYNEVKDWAVDTYNEAKELVKDAASWVDTNIIKPTGKALATAGRQIKDGFTAIANEFSDRVGTKVSAGKEIAKNTDYYFLATVEEGTGYSKDFGDDKPVTLFGSAGENWWEFWKWSIGVDVNINGYGAGFSIGPETSINIHVGDVSHEVGVNSLGRISYKIACNVGDGYEYLKYSLNAPEIAGTAAAIYYGGLAVIPALETLLSSLGGAPIPVH